MAAMLRVGNYEIDRNTRLGAGTYGRVYKGEHYKKPGHFVAAKNVLFRQDDSNNFEKNAIKEIKNLRYVSEHQNLIQLLSFDIRADELWIIMDYCEMGDLDEYFTKFKQPNPGMSLCEKVDLMKQISCGIVHMHSLQPPVAHRDLKPSNVLLTKPNGSRFPIIKICDLGISKITEGEGNQMATQQVGTPAFMAPELFSDVQEQPYTISVDVFSMGVMYLAMLLFERNENLKPYQESLENNARILPIGAQMNKADDIPPVVIIKQDSDNIVKTAIKQLILGIVKKNPGDRLEALEVKERLQKIQETKELPPDQQSITHDPLSPEQILDRAQSVDELAANTLAAEVSHSITSQSDSQSGSLPGTQIEGAKAKIKSDESIEFKWSMERKVQVQTMTERAGSSNNQASTPLPDPPTFTDPPTVTDPPTNTDPPANLSLSSDQHSSTSASVGLTLNLGGEVPEDQAQRVQEDADSPNTLMSGTSLRDTSDNSLTKKSMENKEFDQSKVAEKPDTMSSDNLSLSLHSSSLSSQYGAACPTDTNQYFSMSHGMVPRNIVYSLFDQTAHGMIRDELSSFGCDGESLLDCESAWKMLRESRRKFNMDSIVTLENDEDRVFKLQSHFSVCDPGIRDYLGKEGIVLEMENQLVKVKFGNKEWIINPLLLTQIKEETFDDTKKLNGFKRYDVVKVVGDAKYLKATIERDFKMECNPEMEICFNEIGILSHIKGSTAYVEFINGLKEYFPCDGRILENMEDLNTRRIDAGDIVLLMDNSDIEIVKSIMDKQWKPEMEKVLGCVGIVKNFKIEDNETMFEVEIRDTVMFYKESCLRLIANGEDLVAAITKRRHYFNANHSQQGVMFEG